MPPEDNPDSVAQDVAPEVETVPRARFLASQRNVGRLLAERESLVQLISDLAQCLYAQGLSEISLSGQLHPLTVFRRANAVLAAWVAAFPTETDAEPVTTDARQKSN